MTLRVLPVTPDRWGDMCTLFEQRGPRGGHRNVPAYGCWCMFWRDRSLEHGEPKKRAMAKLVRAGREPGLLAYDGDEPVGWVSLGPREDFPPLLRSPQYRPRDDDAGIWSIVCFVIDRESRRRGLAHELVDAAVAHASARGATGVEAYAHVSNSEDYMGHVTLLEQHGFVPVREAAKRTIMRRDPGR